MQMMPLAVTDAQVAAIDADDTMLMKSTVIEQVIACTYC
jgi:hypothetical protein